MRTEHPSVPAVPTADTAPAGNRAARRGKGGKQVPAGDARHHGAAVHARSAQGRRINPIRRTG